MMMKFGEKEAKFKFMQDAIKLALQTKFEVPVGCVIVSNNKIIARAHNKCEINTDVTAHAEILAIKKAQKFLNTTKLHNCEMYVTLEPCPMCSWAILSSGIKKIYFGSYNLQYGGLISCENLKLIELAKSKTKVYGGIEEDRCNNIINDFFKGLRENEK